MLKIISAVLVLFSLLGVGYLCKRIKIISNDMNRDVGNLLIYVSLPALILVSLSGFSFSPRVLAESGKLLAISFCLYLLFIALSYLFPRLLRAKGRERDIFQFAIVFGNTGFIGFPVAYAVFGQQGVFYMAVCDIFFSLFVWTFGVLVLQRSQQGAKGEGLRFRDLLRQVLNPNIIAVAVGFLLFLTSIHLPEPVHRSFELLGSLTTPLSMIFIGSTLADMEGKKILRDGRVFLCSLQRLLLLPLIVLGLLKLLHFSGYLVAIPVLYAAMPVAASTPIMAAKFGSDYQLASRLIFISTLLSMLTLPALIWALSR